MKIIFTNILVLFSLSVSFAQPGAVVDRIAAQIGDNVILLSEVSDLANDVFGLFKCAQYLFVVCLNFRPTRNDNILTLFAFFERVP